jgi:hypothetical protein
MLPLDLVEPGDERGDLFDDRRHDIAAHVIDLSEPRQHRVEAGFEPFQAPLLRPPL